MASKPRTAQNKPENKSGQVEWVNYNLTKEDKATLKATECDYEDGLLRAIEAGYKVTMSYDDYNRCFSAFLMPKAPDHRNAGMILSGRGSTPLKAFKQAMFIDAKFDGDWQAVRARIPDEIDD